MPACFLYVHGMLLSDSSCDITWPVHRLHSRRQRVVQDNTVKWVPYTLNVFGPAITTYVDASYRLLMTATGSPIKNVIIRRNTVTKARVRCSHLTIVIKKVHKTTGLAQSLLCCVQAAGIGVAFASNSQVTKNTIVSPGAGIADKGALFTVPYAAATGIYLDIVGGSTVVDGNVFCNVSNQLTPQVRLETPCRG